MKSAYLKRWLSALLAVIMLLSLAACSRDTTTKDTPTPAETESTAPEATGITFPLKEEVSFDIMVSADWDIISMLENNQLWKDLYAATNVKVNLIACADAGDMVSGLNNLFLTNKEPDAVFSAAIPGDAASEMAANGLLQPLNQYITAENMPIFTERVVSEDPDIMGVTAMPDGNIYVMPYYKGYEPAYLESPFWINKTWVEAAGWKVEDIKTIDDLETVLTYFAEHDMNGNGSTEDEIPYLIWSENSYNHVEAFLSLYGIATKDNTNDNYVIVENGKVKFAPATDAWKAGINKLNEWYEKGLIWSELFTAPYESYTSKFSGEEPVIGLWNGNVAPNVNPEQYIQLSPVSVKGYTPNFYVNPGLKGGKGAFMVTRSCENVDILMAWLDQFYSLENSVRFKYGEETDGRWGHDANGKIEFYSLDAATTQKLHDTVPTLFECISTVPSAFTAVDYESKLAITGENKVRAESYALYKDYLNQEIWPRPYIGADDTSRLAELRTDIFSTVELKRAEWVSGVSNIGTEYNQFVSDLKAMGLDEFLEILQRNYDNYLASIS